MRPSPSIESNTSNLQNSNPSASEHGESSNSIMSKPMIKFVKAANSPTIIKTNKAETARKPHVRYAEMYRNTSKSPNTFFLKTKDETSGILRNFITVIENLKNLKVKIIMCDNGGEFKNKEMHAFCTRKGIKREFSNARTPHQNGVVEKRNKTLIEAARTMLADTKLPVTFWAEAVNTACYVQNRVLVNKSHNKTSYELFNSRTPAIRFLKPFGCHVMILNTLDHLGKFDAKEDEGYFIGYSMTSKAFRDADTFTSTMLLNVDHLQKQLDKAEFQEDGSMTAFWGVYDQFQKFIDSQVTLDYDSQMTEKYFVEYTRIEGGITIIENKDKELIPTRLVTGWRVCIDYRNLNDATRKDHFPLPFMDKMLEHQEKTTFTCPYGMFPTDECLSAYVMLQARSKGIVLDHKISKSGIEVDRAKVDVIAKLPHPTSIKGVRSFLGHTGFYRRFIQDFLKSPGR
nr:ribonuclease H-like domain-containing protein [Tanacetum cinerariifolium]